MESSAPLMGSTRFPVWHRLADTRHPCGFVQSIEGILEDILADGVILLFQLAVVIEAAPDAYGVFRIEAHNQRIPVAGSRFRRDGYIRLMSVHAWEGVGFVANIKRGGQHLIQNQCFITLQQPLRLNLALVDNIITTGDMGNEGRLNIQTLGCKGVVYTAQLQ